VSLTLSLSLNIIGLLVSRFLLELPLLVTGPPHCMSDSIAHSLVDFSFAPVSRRSSFTVILFHVIVPTGEGPKTLPMSGNTYCPAAPQASALVIGAAFALSETSLGFTTPTLSASSPRFVSRTFPM